MKTENNLKLDTKNYKIGLFYLYTEQAHTYSVYVGTKMIYFRTLILNNVLFYPKRRVNDKSIQ